MRSWCGSGLIGFFININSYPGGVDPQDEDMIKAEGIDEGNGQ